MTDAVSTARSAEETQLKAGARMNGITLRRYGALTAMAALAISMTGASSAASPDVEPVDSVDACDTTAREIVAAELLDHHRERQSTAFGSEVVDVCGTRVSVAQLRDLLGVADVEGLPVSELLGDFEAQAKFLRVVGEIQRDYPDDYAGSIYDPSGATSIAFNAEAPKAATEMIAAIGGLRHGGG